MSTASIEQIWERIERHAGETFRLKQGKEFTYDVDGGAIRLHTANRQIPRSDIDRALGHVSFESTTVVNRLRVQGPSYVYAILMDARIRAGDW
jgi:hypothetical protein